MIRSWVCVFAVFSGVLVSCGGGGGGGGTRDQGSVGVEIPSNDIQQYGGHFSSPCERIDNAVNLDLGGVVYARTYSSVTPLFAKEGGFSFRVDFFADSQCKTSSLGTLVNENPANRITIVGAINDSGSAADKVALYVFRPAAFSVPGGTPGTVVYGSAIRLALPAFMFQNWQLNDLWRLEGVRLIEGGLEVGEDGFPVSLDRSKGSERVTSVPALPAQPCGSQTAQWAGLRSACSAQLAAGYSSSQQWLRDELGPATGSAGFTCSGGVWSQPINASCLDAAPVQPACPEQVWTWTVNGNTCTGTVRANIAATSFITPDNQVVNVTPGLRGAKQLLCVPEASSPTGHAWTEFIFGANFPDVTAENCQVIPPAETDPLQILRNNNCLLCHAVTNAESSFLSFETIANFYRGNPPAPGVLEGKIKSGGSGVFRDFPKPANSHISDDELAIVVPWILSR